MAPVVERSLPEPTPEEPVEESENRDTEPGDQLSVLNHVTKASQVIGNTNIILILKNLPCSIINFHRSLKAF
jgi:hypothetical protein